MTYEVVFYLEEELEKRIVDWMEKMCGGGTNQHILEGSVKPFLRLALFETEETGRICEVFREFVDTIKPWIITFSSVGFYPPSEIFLIPAAAEEISEANMLIHLLLSKLVKQFDRNHLPNLWTPRVSLGLGESRKEVLEAFGVLTREFREVSGGVVSAALICTEPYAEVLCLAL